MGMGNSFGIYWFRLLDSWLCSFHSGNDRPEHLQLGHFLVWVLHHAFRIAKQTQLRRMAFIPRQETFGSKHLASPWSHLYSIPCHFFHRFAYPRWTCPGWLPRLVILGTVGLDPQHSIWFRWHRNWTSRLRLEHRLRCWLCRPLCCTIRCLKQMKNSE